jgi:selenocysteine-specific elongation factor
MTRTFVIGTAGHVDHGKTTLVKALTGIDTDRLPEEKRRGISIELGFAPWKLADDLEATVVDVPGHRRLVHTMIAGASGIELVLLVIAANEGVMPQTREHIRVCEELGITHAVVALTKSDLVDAETLALAEEEAKELLGDRFLVSMVACSATAGTGIDELRKNVAERLALLPMRTADGPARLWVDRVISIRGAGTVVTGTLATGQVKRGDSLVLYGAGSSHPVTARELRVHSRVLEEARSPTRLAVNLAIPAKDIHRGDLLTSDAQLGLTKMVDAALRSRDARMKRGADVSIHTGSAHVAARVTRVEKLDDETQLARLVLEESRPLRGGDRFIVRGASTIKNASVACGGTVLDAHPHPRSRGTARRALLAAVQAEDISAGLELLLSECTPHPLHVGLLHGRLALDQQALTRATDARVKRGELVTVGAGVLTRATLLVLADAARKMVADHLARAPFDRGLPLATLQQKLAHQAGPLAAEAAIRAARAKRSKDDQDVIAIEGDVAVPGLGTRSLDPKLAGAVEKAGTELESTRAHGLSAARVTEVTGAAADSVRAMMAALERQGKAVHLGDLWFARSFVEELRARVKQHFAAKPTLTVIEFKELGALPRKQAVLLLEHFDQVGLTLRKGDARILHRAG